MTQIATIRTGIYNTMVTCGPYDAAQISTCDYGIIGQNSGCAVVVHYGPEENSEPQTFSGGGTTHVLLDTIQFTGECYIQYTGDDRKFLSDVYTARDDIKSTFKKDVKLQSSACLAWVSGFGYNVDEGYEMGGKDWGVLRFVLTVMDM